MKLKTRHQRKAKVEKPLVSKKSYGCLNIKNYNFSVISSKMDKEISFKATPNGKNRK